MHLPFSLGAQSPVGLSHALLSVLFKRIACCLLIFAFPDNYASPFRQEKEVFSFSLNQTSRLSLLASIH